ncbi:MAG: hypothetical protein KIT60_13520 [Burkholderiaceae bacterium]|jgi:hypothetical protein|nr:hypothetical protein [Burkholderiaceae bacterium]
MLRMIKGSKVEGYWSEARSSRTPAGALTAPVSWLATGQIAAAVLPPVGRVVTAQAEPNARYRLLAQAAMAIDTETRVGVTSGRCVGMEGAMVCVLLGL